MTDPPSDRLPEFYETDSMEWLLAQLTAMPTGCTTWPFDSNKGYGRVQVRRVPRTARLVHQVVCEWYHGPRPEGMQVRHLCGHGHLGCFTPAHLRWGTAAENSADKVTHGTLLMGERHGMSRLTETQVREIRRRSAEGERNAPLAREFGVHRTTIEDIVQRRTWAHLIDP